MSKRDMCTLIIRKDNLHEKLHDKKRAFFLFSSYDLEISFLALD